MEVIPTKKETTLIQQLSTQRVFYTNYSGGAIISTLDGMNLITVAEDATTVNVSPLHGDVKFSYKGDTTEVLTMTVSSNHKYLAVSYSSGLVYIYDLTIPNKHIMIIKVYTKHINKMRSVSVSLQFSNTNIFLAMGSSDGFIRVYDLANKYFTHNLSYSHSLVTNILFDDSESEYFIYASSDSSEIIRRFNLHTGKHKDMFGHLNGVMSMILRNKQLVSIGKDNVLIEWKMETLKPLRTTPIPYSIFLCLAGEMLLLGTEDGNIIALENVQEVWKSKEEQRLLSPGALFVAGEEIVHASRDGYLIFYSMDGTVKSYNCLDRESIICCSPLQSNDTDTCEELPFGCSEVLLINNSNALEVHNFLTHSSQLYYGVDDVIMTYCFSPNHDLLFTGYKNGVISMWNMQTRQVICSVNAHGGPVTALCHSMTTTAITSGSNDKYIKVFTYNTSSITQKDAFAAHQKEIQYLKYSLHDRYLVSCSADKTAKLWIPNDGYSLHGVLSGHRPLRTLQGHNGGVTRARFVSDGTQIISCGNDGTVRLWTIKTGENTQTIDVSETRLWSLEQYEDIHIVSGDNGIVTILKNTSNECISERVSSRENEILLGQKLSNLMRRKEWDEALKTSVELNLIKEAYECCENCNINKATKEWDIELIKKLVEFARKWNERNITMIISQKVFSAIFSNRNLYEITDEDFKKVYQNEGFKSKTSHYFGWLLS
ncbi:WD repeat-containing protein SAZD [Entamoeba marina]